MNWEYSINVVRPHVVKIEHPGGHGSGFLAFYNDERTWCGVATAAHVVAHADEWQQPLKISGANGPPQFVKADDRVIFIDHFNDSAVVLFFKGQLELPEVPIALLPVETPCRVGMDVGWLGYPAIEPFTMCFFAGTVSAAQSHRKAYLIDGVAIHGVSGGPVFHCSVAGQVHIIGCVSAYQANRATGEALPGLLRAQDVSHFHAAAAQIRSIDEARAERRVFDESQRQSAGEPPRPAAADQDSR